jgi:hypothetical protein
LQQLQKQQKAEHSKMVGKKLLNNMDANLQFEDCEISDFQRIIWNSGEKDVTEDAILQWLEDD